MWFLLTFSKYNVAGQTQMLFTGQVSKTAAVPYSHSLHRVWLSFILAQAAQIKEHQWTGVLESGKLRITWRSHWKDYMERKGVQKAVLNFSRLVQRLWQCFNSTMSCLLNERQRLALKQRFTVFSCSAESIFKYQQTNKRQKQKIKRDDYIIAHSSYTLFLFSLF